MIKWWSANIWEKWNINEHLFVFVEKTISNLAKLSLQKTVKMWFIHNNTL